MLLGVSLDFSVRFFAVRVVGFALELLLGVGFVTGGVVGLSVAVSVNRIHRLKIKNSKINLVSEYTSMLRFHRDCGHPIGW